MFLMVFLMTLFALTVLAAVERSVHQNRKRKSFDNLEGPDHECAVYRACIQALKNP